MAFKLFKNGDELYEDSKELIKRGEFAKARDYLVKSIDKDGGIDDVAAVQVALIDLSGRLTNVNAYQSLLSALNKLKSSSTVEFGLDTIDAEELKTECALTIRKIQLLSSSGSGEALMQKGKDLQALAQDFQSKIGSRSLIVMSLFKKDTSVTGNTEFYNLMAVSYETMADGTVFDNPQQAAEYQQIAAGYRQQNGQSTEENMRKVREYSRTCTCWVCGRVATGQGIHFYSAPADVSPSLKDSASSAADSRADTKHIYICRACYSAISNRSDEISRQYYQQSMQQMQAMEARLQAQIVALQSQIAFARMGR
ncbi:MAG: hypothetical protein Q4Q58_06650 [Thermoplasmata archaeon]|nr:hypothetical protein [Thermoplasmata archaeon]